MYLLCSVMEDACSRIRAEEASAAVSRSPAHFLGYIIREFCYNTGVEQASE